MQEADDSDPEDEEVYQALAEHTTSISQKILKGLRNVKKEINWIGEPIANDGRRTFYESALVGDEEIRPNDCVLIEPSDPAVPLYIARIVYMFETKNGQKLFHANWFCRGSDTVLGETSDPIELFLIDECEDTPFTSVKCRANVINKEIPWDWAEQGQLFYLKRRNFV